MQYKVEVMSGGEEEWLTGLLGFIDAVEVRTETGKLLSKADIEQQLKEIIQVREERKRRSF